MYTHRRQPMKRSYTVNTKINKLMTAKRPFLTDGGFETWLFFVEGFEAPQFAANLLLSDPNARQKMCEYQNRFLAMAAKAGTG